MEFKLNASFFTAEVINNLTLKILSKISEDISSKTVCLFPQAFSTLYFSKLSNNFYKFDSAGLNTISHQSPVPNQPLVHVVLITVQNVSKLVKLVYDWISKQH